MFSTWDLVRPTLWHPMSMLEQSMMDMDMMANQMMSSRYPFRQSLLAAPSTNEDDDFFRDLPVAERGQEPAETQPEAKREGTRAFSSYSFSNSSVVDDEGRRVTSTRRRYEDSTGRLKAVHEREMDGRCLKTIWNRASKDDQGKHQTIAEGCSPDEFEAMWKKTPFGLAQEQKKEEIKEKGETTAKAPPAKQQEQLGQGVMKEKPTKCGTVPEESHGTEAMQTQP